MMPWLMNSPYDNEPHAVYRIFGDADQLLYVGRSRHPKSRLGQHKRGPWRAEIRRHELTWYPDKDDATVAERLAIYAEHPAHNRRPGDLSHAERRQLTKKQQREWRLPKLTHADT
jgi:predicted GIY-YIG superfamily endonuclease